MVRLVIRVTIRNVVGDPCDRSYRAAGACCNVDSVIPVGIIRAAVDRAANGELVQVGRWRCEFVPDSMLRRIMRIERTVPPEIVRIRRPHRITFTGFVVGIIAIGIEKCANAAGEVNRVGKVVVGSPDR